MTVTTSSFRTDFSEFSNTTMFPDSSVLYYLNFASLMLNPSRFGGGPAPFSSVTATLASAGTGYAVGDQITIVGGIYSAPTTLTPTVIKVLTVSAGAIQTFQVITFGLYAQLPTNPATQASTSGAGSGATFNLTYVSSANSLFDIATELFVAHNIVLEAQSTGTAAVGGIPGLNTGPTSAKSVNSVSVSYNTTAGLELDAGHWNLTIYGTRFMKLVKMMGAGPIQVGIGSDPTNGLNGPAWYGPLIDLGFGSWG